MQYYNIIQNKLLLKRVSCAHQSCIDKIYRETVILTVNKIL